MKLSSVEEKFILHWGEMGTKWGINRTVAQIHALLYLAETALHAEEITRTLSVARSNVSNSLRELQAWGIVRVVHVLGDRRDHFETFKDVWQLFRTVLRERKKREIDPVLAALYDCRDMTRGIDKRRIGPDADMLREHNKRLDDMLQFMELVESISDRFISPAGKGLRKAASVLAKIS